MKRQYEKSQCIVQLKSNWALLRFRYCFACGFEFHREPGWRIVLSFYKGVYDSEYYLCRTCAPTSQIAMELFNRREQLLPSLRPRFDVEDEEDDFDLDYVKERKLIKELRED